MALITQTQATDGNLAVIIARTVLSASDTLTYTPGSKQVFVLYNTTASLVTATIIGSAATTISPAGYGGTISVAAGKPISVPGGSTVLLELDDMSSFLQGTVSITGGVGLTAHLYI